MGDYLLLSSGFIHEIAPMKRCGHHSVYILTAFSYDSSPTNLRSAFLFLAFPIIPMMPLISESLHHIVHLFTRSLLFIVFS